MKNNETCIVCERTEDVIPLILMRYKGVDLRICPEHMPVLIHNPHQIADKLEGAENFTPVDK